MGMTLDEAIERLHDIQKCYNDEITEAMFLGFNDTDNESVDVAIEIMRKYQKIQEIIQHWIDEDLARESPSFADSGTIEDIIEVIKDGEID